MRQPERHPDHAPMGPLLYSLQFRGFASALAAGVVETHATAPGGALVTTVGDAGLGGGFRADETNEAVLEARLVLAEDGFDVSGRLMVGYGNVLRYRALGRGRLGRSPDPHLRQGAVVCEVVGGEGQFAGARGTFSSNLLISDSGDLTDTHLGVMFLAANDGAARKANDSAAVAAEGRKEKG